MSDTTSPPAGAPQTATKAHVAGIITTAAVTIAPFVVQYASAYLDPAWVAKCLDSNGLSVLAAAGVGVVAGGIAWVSTYMRPNKPIT